MPKVVYESALSAAAIKGTVDIVKYLIHEAGATETVVDRRPDNQNKATYDKADQLLKEARQAEYQMDTKEKASEIGADADIEDDLTDMEVPDTLASTEKEGVASDGASTSATPPSDDATPSPVKLSALPPEKAFEMEERAVEADEEVSEVLSPFSWLQVECGYGGDLNGPGR